MDARQFAVGDVNLRIEKNDGIITYFSSLDGRMEQVSTRDFYADLVYSLMLKESNLEAYARKIAIVDPDNIGLYNDFCSCKPLRLLADENRKLMKKAS